MSKAFKYWGVWGSVYERYPQWWGLWEGLWFSKRKIQLLSPWVCDCGFLWERGLYRHGWTKMSLYWGKVEPSFDIDIQKRKPYEVTEGTWGWRVFTTEAEWSDEYISQEIPRMPKAISSWKQTEGFHLSVSNGSAENPKFLTVDF